MKHHEQISPDVGQRRQDAARDLLDVLAQQFGEWGARELLCSYELYNKFIGSSVTEEMRQRSRALFMEKFPNDAEDAVQQTKQLLEETIRNLGEDATEAA